MWKGGGGGNHLSTCTVVWMGRIPYHYMCTIPSSPGCPYHYMCTIPSSPGCPYHYMCTIPSSPGCPYHYMCTIPSSPGCPYHYMCTIPSSPGRPCSGKAGSGGLQVLAGGMAGNQRQGQGRTGKADCFHPRSCPGSPSHSFKHPAATNGSIA